MDHKESPDRTTTCDWFAWAFAWAPSWVSSGVEEVAWACAGALEANKTAAHSASTTNTA
jgi:hypothetical protein